MEIAELRQAAAARALALVGLTAPSPAYLALVAPWESVHDPRRALEIAGLSDCALVAHGYLDGELALRVRGPYVDQMAVHDVIDVAVRAGALRGAAHRPQLGDVLWLLGSATGREHVAIVVAVDVEAYGVLPLTTVDGGQRLEDLKREETIARVERTITYADSGGAMDERVLTGGLHVMRPVGGVLDLEAMITWYGVRAA